MDYHVAYCFDKNYAPHFGASVTSLILNFRKRAANLHIHVITPHDAPEFLERLDVLRSIFSCKIHHVSPTQAHQNRLAQMPVNSSHLSHLALATWYRVLIPELLPADVDRVLYLDADTIVQGCIADLFAEADQDAPVHAVADFSEARVMKHHALNQYVNSGVMLMALAAWRREDYVSQCLAIGREKASQIVFADQCAINLCLGDRINKLSARWNQFVTPNQPPTIPPGGILHFITGHKPWQVWYRHPAGELYWQYRKVSPWRDGEPEPAQTVPQHLEHARKLASLGKTAEAIKLYDALLTEITKRARLNG